MRVLGYRGLIYGVLKRFEGNLRIGPVTETCGRGGAICEPICVPVHVSGAIEQVSGAIEQVFSDLPTTKLFGAPFSWATSRVHGRGGVLE